MVLLACRLDRRTSRSIARLSQQTAEPACPREPRGGGAPVPDQSRPHTKVGRVTRSAPIGAPPRAHPRGRRPSRLARLLATAFATAISGLLAVALIIGIAVPAGAVPPPPVNPSDQQIQDSQQQAASSAAEVGRLAGLVTKTEGDIERLKNDMELKAELANKAAVDLQVAQSDAASALSASTQAQADADAAGQAIVDAKAKAAEFAAASFRQGSVLGSMSAFTGAGSPTEVLQRQELLGQMSGSQLNVIGNLESTRTHKANLDSAARASLDAANAAQQKADEAKTAADEAQAQAQESLRSGQDQLAALEAQHEQQQADYGAALATVAGLQNQRDQYNQWLAAKAAEEEAARLAAMEAARQAAAEAARQAAEEAARQAAAAAAQAAADQAARDAAAAAAAQAEADAERAAAEQEAANQAARQAQEAQAAQANEPYYESCDAARAAGRGPIARGESGYRSALDPNDNGIACEGTSASSSAVSNVSYSSGGSNGQTVVNAAMAYLGTTYAWGGGNSSGPSLGIRDGGVADRYGDYNKIGFDCSGLALYAWAQVGVYLPHYSGYQYSGQPKVSRDNLQ